MRSRIVVVLTVAALSGTVAACGGGGSISIGGPADGPAPTAAPDAGGSSESGEAGGGGTGGDDGVFPGSVPGMSDDCLTASTAFASLTAGLTGQQLPPDAAAQIEAARERLPDDIRDDYDVFRELFELVQSEGLFAAGEQLNSEEVGEAGKRISEYLDEVCDGG